MVVWLVFLVWLGPFPSTEDPGAGAPVVEDGLVAHFYPGKETGAKPGVVVIGGSGGGIDWQDYQAEILAKNGYAALALAYFGMEGLPSSLERIPLEYFEKALRWLARQPGVDAERIGVCGISKGGELVLLLASNYPQVKAVAALVPGAYVFQSIAPGWPVTSSWTKNGEPLPFVPYLVTQNFDRHNLSVMYRETIGQKEYLEAAAIPVERIAGPVLMISGTDDKIWPSTEMCGLVEQRMRAHGFTHFFQHIAYPGAGHTIGRIGGDPEGRNGGTAEANRRAQEDTQTQILSFFKIHL